MTYGVTDSGFQGKRLEDIKSELENDIRGIFGVSTDVSAEGPFGQLIGIFADRLSTIWELAEDVYNSQYPSTSEGTNLDNVASLTGAVRNDPIKSIVDIVIYGDVGTTIPAGSRISVDGNSSAIFETDADATIVSGTNEVQRLSFPTIPETGTFTLSFGGQVTAALNYNATAAQIQAALEALTLIGAGNVSVTGDVSSGTVDVEFINDLGQAPQSTIIINTNTLTSHEIQTIQCVADVGGNLDRTTFILYDKNGSVGVWIDVDNSGSTVPPEALAADRQIEVTGVVTDDPANSVAAAVRAVLDADSEFSASSLGSVITCQDTSQGSRVDAYDETTGFTITTTNQGYSAGSLPVNVTEPTPGVLPQIAASATALETGPTQAPAGTLTVIETAVTGWDSVTNPLDAVPGQDLETDADFRIRREEEVARAGSTTINAIRADLLQLDNVLAVYVFQNNTWITDVDDRPPKSLDIVVQGGDEDEIAEAIFETTAGGILTIGDISKIVVDSQNFDQTIKFSRPTEVAIYVELDLTVDSNTYPADGDDQVKAALVAWGDALGISTDIIVHGTDSLESAISDIVGITDIVIRVGKTASPTTDANITIEPREVADFDTSRIVITQV